MDELSPRSMRIVLAIALASIVVGGSIDLAMDQPRDWLSFHVIFETLMITGAALMATTLWLQWWRSAGSVRELRRSLKTREAERDAWRESAEHALHGLGHAINEQFDRWHLTPAEREVALLLLKGYSHKAIARQTDRGDQTVRQHATAVYAKASLAGRAELAAFFLGDLMLPVDAREDSGAQGDEPSAAQRSAGSALQPGAGSGAQPGAGSGAGP